MPYLHIYNAVTAEYIGSYITSGLPANNPAQLTEVMQEAMSSKAVTVRHEAHIKTEGMFGQFGYGPLPGIFCLTTIKEPVELTDDLTTAIWHDIREQAHG